MSTVTVTVESITDIEPSPYVHALELQILVTDQQRRKIASQLVGLMGQQEAIEWARAEFPELFNEAKT
jgi:hypothetical protein